MVYDLCVIGSGFWGSTCAAMARASGKYPNIITIDASEGQGASRNCQPIDSPRWFKRTSTMTKLLKPGWINRIGDSFEWLERHGIIRRTGRWYCAYGNVRYHEDFYVTVPDSDLCNRWTKGRVSELCEWRGRVEIRVNSGESVYTARKVVIAAGVWTDVLLKASSMRPIGVYGLKGRNLYISTKFNPKKHISRNWRRHQPIVFSPRPYKDFVLMHVGGERWYWGNTAEKKDGDENSKAHMEMLNCLSDFVDDDAAIIKTNTGIRPIVKGEMVFVDKVAKNIVVATGGHKTGLPLAPLAAQDSLRMLR